MSDKLHERGKALEDSFFRERDKQLLDRLRSEMEAKETKQALRDACGINDEATLDALVEVGISPEALTSFAMVPLVAVAWSDGVIQENERDAIMKAAATSGILSDSAGYKLLQAWLVTKPDPMLLSSWKSYIGSLKSTLDPAAFGQLKNNIMGRARDVAEAAGGFLGIIGKISPSEEKTIQELESAF